MKKIWSMLLLMSAGLAFAQEKEEKKELPLSADRPDQTETSVLVPKGMFQMENGFSYEKTNGNESEWMTLSTLIKYGVNDNFELRLIAEYTTLRSATDTVSGLLPIKLGIKAKLTDEKGAVPAISLLGHLLLPNTASKNLKAEYYAAEFRIAAQHTLSDKFNLGYNIGAEWDGETPDATFIYTLTTGASITEKLGAFVEVYGFAPEDDAANHNFDAGLTYLLNNDFMIDASCGVGLTENAPDYFLSAGFSFRF